MSMMKSVAKIGWFALGAGIIATETIISTAKQVAEGYKEFERQNQIRVEFDIHLHQEDWQALELAIARNEAGSVNSMRGRFSETEMQTAFERMADPKVRQARIARFEADLMAEVAAAESNYWRSEASANEFDD
jgi:hypothetical protein